MTFSANGTHESEYVEELQTYIKSSKQLRAAYLERWNKCGGSHRHEDDIREDRTAVWAEFVEVYTRMYGNNISTE